MLKGRKIIVGVTGSIAAYKAALLVRGLVREGCEVRVVMTPLAKEFISPLTMATLSGSPVPVEFFNPENGEWNSHVKLGLWADALVIAPATANTIAKMAGGVADNLLLTTYLSAKSPVFIAPAMDLDMYAHTATQKNINTLRGYGVGVVEPGTGELASGLEGKGRMAEPEEIIEYLKAFFSKKKTLAGRRIMVTAGATVEPIDPVRYISNHSTGRMGFSIAGELASRGAEVILIKGKTSVAVPAGVTVVEALSAADMYDAATRYFEECDAAVMCAAVADYTPKKLSSTKIKKGEDDWQLQLTKTKDIAAALGKIKGERIVAGFALETDNEDINAAKKLESKNLDFIVLNSLRNEGAGFGHSTNIVSILHRGGVRTDHPLKTKSEVAADIADTLESYLGKNILG